MSATAKIHYDDDIADMASIPEAVLNRNVDLAVVNADKEGLCIAQQSKLPQLG